MGVPGRGKYLVNFTYTPSSLTYTHPHLSRLHTFTPYPLQRAEEKVHQKQQAQENFFRALMQAEEMDFVIIDEAFECPICLTTIEAGEGVRLKECLHQFCKWAQELTVWSTQKVKGQL